MWSEMSGRSKRKELIILHPVGVAHKTDENKVMRIEIHAEYVEALEGIEKLSYIDVLYWMHKLTEKDRRKLKVHPRGDLSKPLTGVFATRSPMRPNPIGLTRVRLLRRERNVLFVEGLDALDGSPIIDIKSG